MNRLLPLVLTLVCSVFLLSCADRAPTTALEDEVGSSTPDVALQERSYSPHSLLNGAVRSDRGAAAKGPGPSADGDLTSPLFGLATAPNGDILVADAGAGIATRDGVTELPLPGVTDASPLGRGTMWATEGLTGDPGEDTGQALYRASKGTSRLIADLYAFEEENNPDGADLIDSNPFDVQALSGRAALVADAGANALLRVDDRGEVEVVATFPDEPVSTGNVKDLLGCPGSGAPPCGLPPEIPAQAVPTSIAVGPDGHYYVGELKGFPAPTGASNVWKIDPGASNAQCGSSPDCEKLFDGGFTSIIDLRFDESGTLHVVELDEQSWFAVEVVQPTPLEGGTINACDLGSGTCTEVATDIPIVTAITFGTDGTLWATRNALIPGSAEVFEVTP